MTLRWCKVVSGTIGDARGVIGVVQLETLWAELEAHALTWSPAALRFAAALSAWILASRALSFDSSAIR